MAKTLEKTRKQIAKKKNGQIDSLHENSRDSKRLHRAQIRDDRLKKLEASRKKNNKPLIDRVKHLVDAVRENDWKPLEMPAIQSAISQWVNQHNEEYEQVKKTRRPGRPASAREDLLKMAIAALEKEHKDGFYMPDLSLEKNIQLLERWDKSWSYLTNLSWVKITAEGAGRPSNFPPQSL
ncbi:translation machinery-associated protein 16 [Podospora fimiseda]|uniref:Translation machinery-associated protein 16 n=1 Tax=Podospora fimiseda TaxID=252190 RepID=A0AAN7H4Q4_9PEZI|nr:translation machinery-associated protein 16 [Podospora fimiseda]